MIPPRSFKFTRTKVIVSDAADRAEAAQLRARLAELERTPEDLARLEAERYAVALREERATAVVRLSQAQARPANEHEILVNPLDTREKISLENTWGERAAQALAHIAAIDAELRRVEN